MAEVEEDDEDKEEVDSQGGRCDCREKEKVEEEEDKEEVDSRGGRGGREEEVMVVVVVRPRQRQGDVEEEKQG